MQLTKTQKIIWSAVIVVVLFGAYVMFDRKSRENSNVQNNVAALQNNATTTKEIGNTGVSVSGQGDFQVEQIPVAESVPPQMPSLTAPVVFDNGLSLSPELEATISQKISALQTTLTKNPSDFDSWINLGIYQKMAGDYKAAASSWSYAAQIAPADYVSLGDLGNLYAYFLKDTAKSISYYDQAIGNGPTQSYLYVQLAEVYRDIVGDRAEALQTVDAGLLKIPGDPNLLQIKAGLSQ
jgi:tetratricopeptide (TPR) repeat protein